MAAATVMNRVRFAGSSIALALLVVLGAALDSTATDCDDPGDGESPYAVWVEGAVSAVGSDTVRVGDAVLVVAPPGRGEEVYQSQERMRAVLARLSVGDTLYCDGSLRGDGTVRLTLIEPDSGISRSSFPVSGVVRAVGANTLTVDEDVVTITGGGDFTTRYEQWAGLSGLRVGDVVYVASTRDGDGNLTGNEGAFRMSGAGTVVSGTITATDFSDDPRVLVAGIWCVLDGHESLTGLGGRDPCAYGGDDLQVGWTLDVRGILRDGRVIADDVHVVSKRASAKRRGRVRGSGYVGEAGPRRVVVNGLALATARGAAKAATSGAPRVAAGQRVRFSARAAARGGSDLVVTRLARD